MPNFRAESPEQIARRIGDFERTQNPAALWPGLGESARVAAGRELERVTRLVLNGTISIALDPESRHTAYALGIAGHTTGVGPVIGKWIEYGRVTARADVSVVFAEHLNQSRRRYERMEHEVLPALDALLARSITPVVLKGFHTSRTYYDEAAARRMTDVDLLIPADRVKDAEAALGAAGFTADSTALSPYKRDWLGPGVDPRLHSIELSHERSKWVLEMHASLDRVYHPGAVARLNSVRDDVVRLSISGRDVLALSPSASVVYLACHCAQELDGIRLLRVFEIVSVLRRAGARGELDWDAVLSTLVRTRSARFAYPALALVNDLDPGVVDDRVLALGRKRSTWAAKHTVARLSPAGGSLDERGVIRQLMWTRGPVSIATRLLRNLWPAAFTRPRDVLPGWRVRIRRIVSGDLSLSGPNERD
jgi:hypothetical protein